MKAYFVTKHLAFGSAITKWRHVEQLQELGITHVINLRRNGNRKVREFEWIWLPFKDDKEPRPRWFYKRALKFYQRAMHERNAKLFVMCRMGICRSASLTYFLLRASGRSKRQALRVVLRASGRSKRQALRVVLRARPWATVARAYLDSSEEHLRRQTNH